MNYFYRVYGLNIESEILVPELSILKEHERIRVYQKDSDHDDRIPTTCNAVCNAPNREYH